MVYKIIVSSKFFAKHKVRLPNGEWEKPHEHVYRVEVCLVSSKLDENGMVVDFLKVKDSLDNILSKLNNTDLNENPFLQNVIPTAENLAMFIFTEIKKEFTNLEYVKLFETEDFSCIVSE